MALTPADSTQITNLEAVPPVLNSELDIAPIEYATGKLTFTAAGTGTAGMLKLPAGKIRVWNYLSRVTCPQGTAMADLHVGFASYTDLSSGSTVSADDNYWLDNGDVGGGAIDAYLALPAATPYTDFDSLEGIEVQIMIDTANSPASGDAIVLIAFSRA